MPFDSMNFKAVSTKDELLDLMRWEKDNPPKTWLEGLRRLAPWLREGHLPVGHKWDYTTVQSEDKEMSYPDCGTIGCAVGVSRLLWGRENCCNISSLQDSDGGALFLEGWQRLGKMMYEVTGDDIADLIEEYLLDPKEYMRKENA